MITDEISKRMAEIIGGKKLMKTPEGEFYFEGEARMAEGTAPPWIDCDKPEPVKEIAADITDKGRRDAMATIAGL